MMMEMLIFMIMILSMIQIQIPNMFLFSINIIFKIPILIPTLSLSMDLLVSTTKFCVQSLPVNCSIFVLTRIMKLSMFSAIINYYRMLRINSNNILLSTTTVSTLHPKYWSLSKLAATVLADAAYFIAQSVDKTTKGY